MLVKNLKCTICGANKVNSGTSMYIYCDYCGSWMGLDLLAASSETADAMSYDKMNNPLAVEYRNLTAKIAEIAAQRDKQELIDLQLQIQETEFKLFPERHGVKSKQPAYRTKYMEFYKMYYDEVIDDDYFDRFTNNSLGDVVGRLKFELQDGKVNYEFNEDFKEYIDESVKLISSGVETAKKLQCLAYHPEQSVAGNPKLMQQVSIAAFIQAFTPENAEQIIEYLGLKHEYIEIPDVNFTEFPCKVCEAKINVPENGKTVCCESCGSLNKVETGNIQCLNCSGEFSPTENQACPYCGGKVESPKSMQDLLADKYKTASTQKEEKKKGGFFARLFGKK